MIDIIGLLSSAAGGGALGVLGNFLKSKSEIKIKQLDHEHEKEIKTIDIRAAESDARIKLQLQSLKNSGDIAAAELAAARDQIAADSAIVKSSHDMDAAKYGGGFVDFARGIMRPFITIYLLVIMSYIGYELNLLVGGMDSMGAENLFTIYRDLINSIVFLATTAVTWWFGSRPTNKK